MAQGLLGELTPSVFLRRHWQRQPLFVAGAMAGCGEWIRPELLFDLAARDDVESRLVMRARGRWTVQSGPFPRRQWSRMPARGWTLLVQGVEQHCAQGADLLQQFSFIPHARLDDLMVSYAPHGAGVGPHFDSYDVFLLQGMGTRRWRISAQKDLALVEHAPLRVLKHFRHTQEWIAHQGDLLYLPPQFAHEGVAMEPCMTLSVGFRAPRHQELASGFLDYLQDALHIDGIYQDRDLTLQHHPACLSPAMLKKFSTILNGLRWNEKTILAFSGRYLSEPKAQTQFEPPRRALSYAAFCKRVADKGVRLASASRLLFSGSAFFINGECCTCRGADRKTLIRLADHRCILGFTPTDDTASLLYTWYRAGYIEC